MFQAGEVQTNIQLTNTYKVIIKSPVILEQVNEKIILNMTTHSINLPKIPLYHVFNIIRYLILKQFKKASKKLLALKNTISYIIF